MSRERRQRSETVYVKDAATKTMTELLEEIAKQEAVTAEINKLEADKERIEAISKANALVHKINNPTPIVSLGIKSTIQDDRRRAQALSLKELQGNTEDHCK